tara:strand:- start:1455 stop:2627 length:1173 start_codon:yes stop_codon:yes gene_type:complete
LDLTLFIKKSEDCMKFLLKIFLLIVALINVLVAAPISTSAKYAIIMDFDTENILLDKSAKSRIYPASMSKLMTLYILFEQISEGAISFDSEFLVSKKAWKKGGSKMFVEVGSYVKVIDLLKGIIIQSGNDACIVVAEGISGNEQAFADLMNVKAKELGLLNSNFKNSTGWPDKDHYMTPYDLALLSKKIIDTFPSFLNMFKEKEFTFNNIKQGNRNPLLYSYKYSDGLKTGYTDESGFSLAATALKSGRRLITVLSGMDSVKERRDETIKLLEWGFREYVNVNLFEKNEAIIEVDVWLGNKAIIELITKEDINFTLRKKNINNYSASVVYNNPIAAPIKTNIQYGKLVIKNTFKGTLTYPLYAKQNINKAGIFKKISSAFSYFIFGGYAE